MSYALDNAVMDSLEEIDSFESVFDDSSLVDIVDNNLEDDSAIIDEVIGGKEDL